ncbi:hypothetical protein EMCG_09453 [[Emmonsia] crescens]|uniref:Uncharacterized protein n=1 Tax=[Emmonsia] crescens TaxID=73230 RepID=A0A0G2J324_9EURO|nr:hypothetical protein EMCG_09453 [Emmonsia crescens UAMH 3008]
MARSQTAGIKCTPCQSTFFHLPRLTSQLTRMENRSTKNCMRNWFRQIFSLLPNSNVYRNSLPLSRLLHSNSKG